jgi:hypothetical protein
MTTETTQSVQSPETAAAGKMSEDQALARKWKADLCGIVFPTEEAQPETVSILLSDDSSSS